MYLPQSIDILLYNSIYDTKYNSKFTTIVNDSLQKISKNKMSNIVMNCQKSLDPMIEIRIGDWNSNW